MIIRKHILVVLVAILAIFTLNFAVNFWSVQQKGVATELLQRSLSRQALTISIRQEVGDFQKQVERLGLINSSDSGASLPAEELGRFKKQSASIAAEIALLHQQSDAEMLPRILALKNTYADLEASWKVFFENFGSNHIVALTEQALHTEPLSRRVLYEVLPAIEEAEQKKIGVANKQLDRAKSWSNQMSLIAFVISLGLSVFLAVHFYRRMAGGLAPLLTGARFIRSGNIDHRVSLQTNDEFGEVAESINRLSDDLRAANFQRAELDQGLAQCHAELENQKQVSESLLRNILPATIAEELRTKGAVAPKYLEDVTILFTDFVGFSSAAESMAADELVHMLHDYFSTFDEIAARYGLEKVKTIGDSYMCAGGVPERNPSHPVDAVMAAMEIIRAVEWSNMENQHSLSIRIGIHTGHVIAGVVGQQKFAYDLWGESVNYASRVESSGEPNRIAMSSQTYMRVKDFFECEKQIKSHAKVAQDMELYFVKGIQPGLLDESGQMPPAAFQRRYQSYFQKAPASFPLQPKKFTATTLPNVSA